MNGTIVTLGGGGFSATGRLTPIDDLLLSLTGVPGRRRKVCFVPTASGDDLQYGRLFEEVYASAAQTSVLSLFCSPQWGYSEPKMLLDQDLVFVGGGSTANLLALWRLHGVPEILAAAAANGTVLSGISAGMNCWFDGSSTDSFGPLRALPDGLGFLEGSACPHLFGEAGRRESYRRMIATGELPDGYAADDGVALVWRDGELAEAVAEKPEGRAFRVERAADSAGGVVETPLEVRRLG